MPRGGNGQISFDVDVRLKVLQSSVKEIQEILNKLEPDSSGYKEISKIIDSMKKDMDQLQIQTAKPFVSEKQFQQTEKTIDKLENSLGRAKIAVDRIKFSDLKLDPQQQETFEELRKKIVSIKTEYEAFKEREKIELFKKSEFKEFADSIDPNLINKKFDQVVNTIQKKTESIDKALQASINNLNKYTAQVQVGENIKSFIEKGGITRESLGEDAFNKMFTKNSTFKAGGKSLFFEYLKQQFSITDEQLNQLKDLSAKKIQELISSEDFWKPQLKASTKAVESQVNARTEVQRLTENAEQAKRANEELGASQERVAEANERAAASAEQVTQEEKENEEAITNAAKAHERFRNGTEGLKNGLDDLRDALTKTNVEFLKNQHQLQTFNSIKMAITNFMGFHQVLNLTKTAVREAMEHIKQLDETMNSIAIVTDMTTEDLWKQIDSYSQIAQTYGVTIQGAYEVSKIYYQAGYETNDVLALMNETLKLSKVSGLDYAKATDYMMTATRGFHMEISEAAKVVDVYSNLAANTAVSQEELATAMSRTASALEGVGVSFSDASAMIATMEAVTRETASNIGSAMKSISSRYGELTKDPKALFDADGEEMSFNKVDTALRSVGISLQTADHQFRSLTDVLLELTDVWDTLDSTQQRYIATQFAGNRMQSRFLAVVSNGDLLRENMRVAEESEDVGTLQALDALDSLSSKLNQVQVAYQQFYTSIGAENVWKGALDGIRGFIDSLNDLPKLFDIIPVSAITVLYDAVTLIRDMLLKGFSVVSKSIVDYLDVQKNTSSQKVKQDVGQTVEEGTDTAVQKVEEGAEKVAKATADAQDKIKNAQNKNQNTNSDSGTPNQTDSTQQNLEVEKQRISTFFTERANYYKEEAEKYRQEKENIENQINSIQEKNNYTLGMNKIREYIKSQLTTTTNGKDSVKGEVQDVIQGLEEVAKQAGVAGEEIQKALNEKNITTKRELAEYLKEIGVDIEKIDTSKIEHLKNELKNTGSAESFSNAMASGFSNVGAVIDSVSDKISSMVTKTGEFIKTHSSGLTDFSMALNVVANAMDKSTRGGQVLSGSLMGVAGAIKVINALVTGGANVWMTVAMGAITIVNGISVAIETTEEKLERLTKDAENLTNEAKRAKSDYNTLQRTADKLDELKEKRYENEEAAKEYQAAIEELKDKMPGLITGLNEAGEATMDISNIEEELSKMRDKSTTATINAIEAEIKLAKLRQGEAERQAGVDRQNIRQFALEFANSFNTPTNSFELSNKDSLNKIKESFGQQLYISGLDQGSDSDILNQFIRNTLLRDSGLNYTTVDNLISPELEIRNLNELQNAIEANADYFGEQYQAIEEYLNFLNTDENTNEIITNINKAERMLNDLSNIEIVTDKQFSDKLAEFSNFMIENNLYQYASEAMSAQMANLMNSYLDNVGDVKLSADELRGFSAQEISTLLKNTYTLQSGFLEDQTLLINYLNEDFIAWSKREGNQDKTIEDYMRTEGINKIDAFRKRLNDAQWKVFNESWKNIDQYSFEDWIKNFGLISEDDPLYLALQNYYNTYRKTKERIDNQIKNITEKYGLKNDYNFTGISEEMASFVTSGNDLVSTYLEQGYVKTGENLLDSINDVFLESRNISQDNYGAVSNVLKNMAFTTEGINEAIKNLVEIDESDTSDVVKELEQLRDGLLINIPLSVQAYTDELISQIDNISDSMKKASKGFDKVTDAKAFVDQVNSVASKNEQINLDDLIRKNNGKLMPTQHQLELYYQSLINDLSIQKDNLMAQISTITTSGEKAHEQLSSLQRYNNDRLEKGIDYDKYFEEAANLLTSYGYAEIFEDGNGQQKLRFTELGIQAKNSEEGLIASLANAAQVSIDELDSMVTYIKDEVPKINARESAKEEQDKLKTVLDELQKTTGEFISEDTYNFLIGINKDFIEVDENGAFKISSEYDRAKALKAYLVYVNDSDLATEELINQTREAYLTALQTEKEAQSSIIDNIRNWEGTEDLRIDLKDLPQEAIDTLKEAGATIYTDVNQAVFGEGTVIDIPTLINTLMGIFKTDNKTKAQKYAKSLQKQWDDSNEALFIEALSNIDNISIEQQSLLQGALGIKDEDVDKYFKNMGGYYQGNENLLALIRDSYIKTGREVPQYLLNYLYDASETITDKLRDVGKQIGGGIGDEVNEQAVSILRNAGYKIEQIGSKYFITGIGDLEQAYLNFYQTIIDIDNFSEAEIKEARQNIINAHNTQRSRGSDFIKSLGDLEMGMYADFSDEFSRNGLDMSGRATKKQFKKNASITKELEENLKAVGAKIQDGILMTFDDTDPIGVNNALEIYYSKLAEAASDADVKSQNERLLAQVQDSTTQLISNYSDLISNAISGTLTNTQALDLQKFASNYGIKVDFHEMEKGLKASQQSAMDLYLVMKDINYLQSRTLFKDLSDNLKESRTAYQDVVSIQGHIADLQKKINDLPVSSARRQEYERELEVAKEIRETRSLTDEDAFNFMDRDLPTPYKAQLGYWDSIGSAFKEMNDAADTGYMDVQKFYNMVNGFNEMAANMGSSITFMGMELDGSMESASKLIQKGFQSLSNVDGDGAKISLERFGNSFADGAAGMQKGIKGGIRDMAKSQIEMLDAMIAFLETIVAFEKFEKLDTDGEFGLSFEELFNYAGKDENGNLVYKADKNAKKIAAKILDLAKTNKDLAKGLDGVRINNTSAREALEALNSDTAKTKDELIKYQKLTDIMYRAAASGDFSTQNLTKLIQEAFAGSKEEVEVEVFDRKFSIKSDVVIERSKNGKYKAAGYSYDTFEEAEAAMALAEKEDVEVKHDKNKGTMWGDIHVDSETIVHVSRNIKTGVTTYSYNGYKSTDRQEIMSHVLSDKYEIAQKNGYKGTLQDYIIEQNLIPKLKLNASTIAKLDGTPVGNLSDEILTAAGIDVNLVTAVEAGIERAFQHVNLPKLILGGLLYKNTELTENPYSDAGDQIGGDISDAVVQGIENKNEEDPNAIPDAVAEGVKDENGVVESEGETLGDTLVNTLTSLADPDGPMKLAGMDAAAAFVEGFTLTNVNDQTSSFGEVFGQQISNAVIPPIQNALKELFSETSLAEIIPLFETNSELTLAFDSIKIDSLTTLVEGFESAINTAVKTLSSLKESINALPDKSKEVGDTATAMKDLPDKSIDVQNTANAMKDLHDKSYEVNSTAAAIDNLHSRSIQVGANIHIDVSGVTTAWWDSGWNYAKGNFSLAIGNAFATGNTLSIGDALTKGRQTLMGELGPELYVTGGRYYVAGQNGAEMVDLPDDAIVFNHMQTKRLLGTGHSGRGKPVTNEKNAVSFATGNAGGPAMATAQETLAQLKALRAMWQSMLNASFKDLGGLARSAKDKEKSKSNSDKTDKQTELRLQRIVKDVERWYNLERQIAKIDKDIAYSEKLINKYQNDRVVNGNEIYNTYKTQLKLLDSEIDKNRELVQIQRDWYDEKRSELDNSVFGLFMSYDENGLQQLKNMDILEKLQEQTTEGEGINNSYSVREQVALLASLGADISSLLYDNSDVEKYSGIASLDAIYGKDGQRLEGQDLYDAWAQIMNNFYSELEEWKGTMDSAYDGMHETEEKIIDEITQQNQILQTLVDNQIEVENTVLDAIVDSREAEIDELQKMRDAYEESVNQMVDGLSEALDNERKIYEESQDQTELTKLQRQLAILQRSGGSASQIRNLQDQINSKQQDMYFDARQKEIDAIQTAADKQIERMDTQIDLMTETLEYQKEHGLLWDEVYQVMSMSEAEIERFIVENGAEWSSKSHLQKQEDIRALIEKIQLWTQKRDDPELEQIANKVDNASVTTANRNESSFSKVEKKELTPWRGGLELPVTEQKLTLGDDDTEVKTTTTKKTSTSKKTTTKKNNYDYYDNYSYGGSTGHFTEGSTMTYSYSNGKYKETGKRIGHTGESLTVLQTDGEKSLVEYNGSQYWIKTKRIAYKNGGLIDFTGPAWVDGSKSKPEAIFSNEQVAGARKMLDALKDVRNKWQNGSNNSKEQEQFNKIREIWKNQKQQEEALENWKQMMDTAYESLAETKAQIEQATTSSVRTQLQELEAIQRDWLNQKQQEYNDINDTNNNGNIYIDTVELNMNAEIKDGYSAKRAGQQVFDEFVHLARKNGVNSLSRR